MEDTSIRYIKGVGEKKAKYFEKLGVYTARDLLALYPRRYENIGNIVDIRALLHYRGEKVSVVGQISHPIKETRISGGNLLTTVYVSDDSGTLRIVYFNNKYIKNMLRQDETYLFYGKVSEKGEANLTNPEFYPPEGIKKRPLLPVYPLTSGLSQKFMRKTVALALGSVDLSDVFSDAFRKKYGIISFRDAMTWIHNPPSQQQADMARARFIFEELLYYSLGLRFLRRREKKPAAVITSKVYDEFLKLHPFSPTDAQARALSEIYSDLESGNAMNRLLQGDVGSGKTLVAGQAAYNIIKHGAQAAIMVPTEVLANQHYRYFEQKFSLLGIKTALLTSSCTAAQKREIKKQVKSGEISMLVGTHALIQKDVEFSNLGLVITDEQHRFGVMQRAELSGKTEGAHILVMSATPIPRTLALMMWGDLSLSVIDVMPEGRQKVSTYLVDSSFEARLLAFIQKNIDAGGRVYVVCPMIEQNEDGTLDLTGAKERYSMLAEQFGEQNVGLVHGKMKAADKDKAMRDFADGSTKILVSTTVIEVGVNVPEATLMIIENAERFGLSQLHQLRGRVGRGDKKSYCVLVSDSDSERLSYFTQTTDGFEIAKKDLELRGPGNFFGRDQSGLPAMKIADMTSSTDQLAAAVACAEEFLKLSPDLEMFPLIKRNVLKLFESDGEIFN